MLGTGNWMLGTGDWILNQVQDDGVWFSAVSFSVPLFVILIPLFVILMKIRIQGLWLTAFLV